MTKFTECKMIELNCNSEGLRACSMMDSMFSFGKVDEVACTDEKRFKSWMVHNLISTTRSYKKARDTVVSQVEQPVLQSGTAMFHIFEFSEYIEYCITSLNRLCVAAKQSRERYKPFDEFCFTYSSEIERLGKFRNKIEHLHSQVSKLQAGKGPVLVTLNDSEDELRLLKLKYPLSSFTALINGYYLALTKLFPNFDASSSPMAEGPLGLSMSVTISQKPMS